MQFFDIPTSTGVPNVVCFAYMFTSKCASRPTTARTVLTYSYNLRSFETASSFTLLTSTCASRHNGVHFLNISTPKSDPTLRRFAPFYFEMCFAPQRRALCQQLNFQECSEPEVFRQFGPRNVLRTTTACTFSRLFYLFARLHFLSSGSFSSLIFFLLLSHLSILSEV